MSPNASQRRSAKPRNPYAKAKQTLDRNCGDLPADRIILIFIEPFIRENMLEGKWSSLARAECRDGQMPCQNAPK